MRSATRSALPRRVLVVGCGFIGERFARVSLAHGLETVVLTRSPPDGRKLGVLAGAELLVGDASDAALLRDAVAGAAHVVYAAGGLMPAESEQDPAGDASLTFPPLLTLLEVLRKRSGPSLTYLSSGGTVYGRPRYLPVDEEHPTNPVSSYGVIKLATEKFVSMHAAAHGLRARILRCSNAYGEDQPPDRSQGVVAAFVERLVRGEPIVLYGDGQVVRDFVYVGDVAEVGLSLATYPPEPQVVNVGAGRGHSLNELIDLLERASDRRFEIERRPARGFDISEIVLDISRLRTLFGFEPTLLEEGVERMLAAHAQGSVEAAPHRP